MPTRSTLALTVGLLVAAIPLALHAAPAPDKTPPGKAAPTAKPTRTAHADGSVSIALEHPDHGLVASLGVDGRVRIACVDAEHMQLDKRAHERLHDDDATAWE